MESGEKPKKTHKKRAAGQKAKKKKTKQLGKVEKHNPKAHTFSGGKRSVQRRVQYTLERQAKKDKAPKVDKTPEVPPPFIVVVQGPPGVGKTTLIQSLVKHYAKWAAEWFLHGSGVTLVSGRHRRLTIIECPQAMSAMLDLAKIADLVLLLIDASYGFELETFEFINILQVHGFPRVIGVLTHLDSFKENKQLRKVKKSMKHRFWAELYDGAKLFYLSGLQYGRYHRLEIQNLARFIAVQKAPLLSWRQSHPYVLALRWEDQTDPTLPEASARRLDLYGYVYGGRLREGIEVHLPGVGDFNIAGIKKLTDPCPPPQETEAERRRAQARKGDEPKKNALRTLAERHRVVYAPGSEIGSITVDSEAMYIYVPDQQVPSVGPPRPSELPEAVRALQESEGSLDKVSEKPNLRLVSEVDDSMALGALAEGDEVDEGEEEEAAEEDVEERDEEMLSAAARRFARAPKLEEMAPWLGAVLKAVPKGAEKVYGSGTEQFGSRAQPENLGTATDHHTERSLEPKKGREARLQGSRANGRSSALLGNLGDLDGLDSARMPKLPGEELAWDESRKEALKARKFITGGWSSAEEEEEDEEKEEKAPAEDGEAAEEIKKTLSHRLLREGTAGGYPHQRRFGEDFWPKDTGLETEATEATEVPVQSSETRKRCFPDLEADHPFCKIAKTKENGKQFYNNPWDSNACLVVNDRCFFVHKYFVTESSGFFKNLFADDAETTSGDYTLRLDEKLRDDYFEFILRWMYTGRVDGINAENCISMIREAKFLLMNEDFVRILYQTFIKACKSSDSSSTLAESLSQQASDLLVKELFNLLDDCGFSADLRLKCLVLWAHQFPLLHGEDAVLLRKHLSDLIEKCTADGLASLVKQSPEAFDIIPASTLFKLTQSDGWDVPAACVAELRREKRSAPERGPIILGGLLAGESRMGLVQTRIKRHRWHPKLLKSSDALLLSVGWRRFQTLPVFSLEDRGEKRMRYLKYTLEHAHCTMTCYGPMVPPNTGVLAFRSWEKVGHFRVCGTGVVLEAAPNFEVKKKLKLVGEPYKIFRNTAFIKNMFSSDLEVNKYMHAKIQTVSGIRGEIKKAEGVKGQFRASFEDRILMSDLVVCKCWITVPFKEFYHPVLDVPNWRPARLIGELRAAQGVPVPDNPDSRKAQVDPTR
ncbi:Ribosome biogenesis protein BMS1 homolog (Ribosome assembly protein BMS1 homolog) [Durusdinium trenchii]|uniref:Ribosome biogenesis protein BMS1 homolog (Ribosome assembly protein BMS1 homolog) n=1 Tax=Durusdinium trenchii TaxID=1381693 RepID=A0ABP0K5L0_9DINO